MTDQDTHIERPDDDSAAAAARRATRLKHAAYWRANVRLVGMLLVVWFVVSFGAGIILVDVLDAFRLPGTGFPLGFWFAQQGAIFVFVALIWIYAWRMNRLEREFDVHEK